jgi:hypothetical protein
LLPPFDPAHQSLLTVLHLSILDLFLIESTVIETMEPLNHHSLLIAHHFPPYNPLIRF